MDREEKNAFVARLAAHHDGKLRRFIEARLRHAVADVPDLMQEVFLRLIRIRHPEAIRTPEAYLYTVAKAVLHQHRAQQATVPQALDIAEVLAELEEACEASPEAQVYAEQRLAELRQALSQLPRKAYVTLILNRVVGMPLDQIGEHLGISRPMAKKYLARALAHCRQRDQETG